MGSKIDSLMNGFNTNTINNPKKGLIFFKLQNFFNDKIVHVFVERARNGNDSIFINVFFS